ncbi:hypothetical protein LSM04_001778 [Trypanosoma melophagium]|uniref:uncharacterized protein n=1 Tax=Trypanosoma melophagium TaxID=715481 RepID=UPI00351A8E76|nr:hypothetical protein LSM04_001778 [Trypanosoma melophagium]
MTAAHDKTVGAPYVHNRYAPQEAALLFPFLTLRPRTVFYTPRLYRFSGIAIYTNFVPQSCFLIVGYRGILCGQTLEHQNNAHDNHNITGNGNFLNDLNEIYAPISEMEDPLWNSLLFPFQCDFTWHPALGSLCRVYTVKDDPTWFLFVSHNKQQQKEEENEGEGILDVRIIRVLLVEGSQCVQKALLALLRHHFGETVMLKKKLYYTLSTVNELFNTARQYASFHNEKNIWNRSLASSLTREEYIQLAEIMISKKLASVINTTAVPTATQLPHPSSPREYSNDAFNKDMENFEK